MDRWVEQPHARLRRPVTLRVAALKIPPKPAHNGWFALAARIRLYS
jgi:hypothetical protein